MASSIEPLFQRRKCNLKIDNTNSQKVVMAKVYYTHVIQIYVNVRNFRLSFLRWHELHWCKHLKSSSRVGHCFGSRTFLPWGQFPEKLVPYTRFSAYRLIYIRVDNKLFFIVLLILSPDTYYNCVTKLRCNCFLFKFKMSAILNSQSSFLSDQRFLKYLKRY